MYRISLFAGRFETYCDTNAGNTSYFGWTWYDWDRWNQPNL